MGVRRVARRTAMMVAGLLIFVSMALLALVHTPWGRGRILQLIETQASRVINGELRIGSVSGGLFTGLDLSDVTLRQGEVLTLRADRVLLHYSALQLLRGDSIIIDRLHIRGLALRGARLPSGSLTLASLLKPRDTPRTGGARRPIEIRDLQIEGGNVGFDGQWGPTWAALPRAIAGIKAALSFSSSEKETVLTIRQFSG
ncbi:MAG: hypothetical protein ABIS06_04580, partial [Vicinamibacterales bacterium]